MRIIKFRAWLKSTMYYQDENTASAMNGLERFTQIVGDTKGFTPEVMQFTGLLDKNGKEIYEGDIFTYKCPNCDDTHTEEVKYIKKLAAFNCGGISRMSLIEVIGNKHENPELLK